ncbi:MAG: glycoside hydrolase family 3 C-terminal domain-containing protein, partial [Oscillospiraceae bacterium]|nr:glycoside hydrolase family 3 C-terminal domain-containing protein [Oscillospiraceae bacterium]
DFWNIGGCDRLKIPKVCVSDGPHGLRRQENLGDYLGVNQSIRAVCFPAGCATASSFSRKTARRLGETLGEECQAMSVSTILGPAMNIKRTPLCGRNFEYYSEDPLLAGNLAAALIRGVQSKGVGTSIKHFLANNQESRRMTNSSEADERTLREIYLTAFEIAVKQARPWTVMCSYNRINGTYASENPLFLQRILRDEWGFDGYVMSDWGAVNDRIKSIQAGLDLEMPGPSLSNQQRLIDAVEQGTLSETTLDQACERILTIIYRFTEGLREPEPAFNYDRDHAISRQIEEDSMVLLKNAGGILPLDSRQPVAFIGQYARAPRYQGGGSSHINSYRVESALEAAAGQAKVLFAEGFHDDQDQGDPKLVQEAVALAQTAQAAVIFAGLPERYESEGYDRTHLNMPENQNQLIEAVAKVQPNTIVVLHNGSSILMPWLNQVKAVLEAYLGGQAVGAAVFNVLYGRVNPSGRLAETFPLRLEDTPAYLSFNPRSDISAYREGVFVGYRYYSSKNQPVLFPFGYGLSYTEFRYDGLSVDKKDLTDQETLHVAVNVSNIGQRPGQEVVQLYVAPPQGQVCRPVRELKAFDKIFLQPGETGTVSFALDQRAFAYWSEARQDWLVESGAYQIQICRHAALPLAAVSVFVHSTAPRFRPYHLNSTFGDIMADPAAAAVLQAFRSQHLAQGGLLGMTDAPATEPDSQSVAQSAISEDMIAAMLRDMPLRQLQSFGSVGRAELEQLVEELNQSRG